MPTLQHFSHSLCAAWLYTLILESMCVVCMLCHYIITYVCACEICILRWLQYVQLCYVLYVHMYKIVCTLYSTHCSHT